MGRDLRRNSWRHKRQFKTGLASQKPWAFQDWYSQERQKLKRGCVWWELRKEWWARDAEVCGGPSGKQSRGKSGPKPDCIGLRVGGTWRGDVANWPALWEVSRWLMGRFEHMCRLRGKVWAAPFHSHLRVISVDFLEFCYSFLRWQGPKLSTNLFCKEPASKYTKLCQP